MARTTTTYTTNLGETITLTENGFVALDGYATEENRMKAFTALSTRRDPAVGERVILGTADGYRVVTIERETKAQLFAEGVAYWKNTNFQFFRTVKRADEFGVLYFAGSANGFEFALSQLTDEERAFLAGEDAQPEPATLEDEELEAPVLTNAAKAERHLANALRLSLKKSDEKLDAFLATQTTAALKLEVPVQRDRRKAQVRTWKAGAKAEDWPAVDLAAQAIAELERRERAILRELKKRGVSE